MKKKTVKAFAIIGKSDSELWYMDTRFGRQPALFLSKKHAKENSTVGEKVVPCTITYEI